jgi:hypothetical protein
MFILVSFSPNTKRSSDDVRKTIAPFGAPLYSLPGGPLVMRCATKDAADDARLSLIRLRKGYVERGKAFEFMWLRVNPTELDYFPQRPKERPSWRLEVLADVFARDE